MPDITVANTDWSILADVRDALASAAIGGQAVFASVALTTSPQQARECHFRTSPAAVVRYLGTHQQPTPDEHLACRVEMEVLLAVKVPAGVDESARLQEILRLANAARNAVGAARPAAACDWGDGRHAMPAVAFAPPSLDTAESAPWAIAALPLSVTYTLDGPTAN
ncbi:MAG: hypothetical protein BWX88_01113 [Planctomycetes bacterium ADurb.Bin126]|nr:MAG: hypothetical protein BWX88_01113 [Planctomycetes bacterium ADurb.Bin126]HOD83840.1 hypothetical protein [Phycisphaerae bacterium]HQL72715.1 hypothetical protein [Phycisphaerae bacterium]